jgi:hypothetical protein
MTAGKSKKKIDELQEQAAKLLATKQYFDAEERAQKALAAARSACDFERLAEIAEILCKARRGRYEQALGTGSITVLAEALEENLTLTPGCYVVQPPLVGADARRLRIAALEAKTPIAVVCREPITQLRLCPIVAMCPGTTIRTQIDPPEDLDDPDLEWFDGAIQQLGEWTLSTLDPDMDPVKRVDAIIERLGALPENARLHAALVEACRVAAAAGEEHDGPPAKPRSPARSR